MIPRYLTIDCFGQVYHIEKLLDREGKPTTEPALCATAIMLLSPGNWREVDPDIVPIYTVH